MSTAARPQPARPVRIDTDAEGYPYRRGEILALDLDEAGLERLSELGYLLVSREPLDGADVTLYVLKGPAAADPGLESVQRSAPGAVFALNHVFAAAGATVSPRIALAAPASRPCACRVGMLDTGVDPAHPALQRAHVVQRGFGGGEAQAGAHGNAVASLILGQIGGPSSTPEVYVADIFSPGPQTGSAAAVVTGLSWLAKSGATVINVSLTGPPNPVVAKVIENVVGRGVLVVAAAGNDGPAAPPVFPAAYPQVVAVTAVDSAGRPYRYANRGTYVMFSALGVDLKAAGANGAMQVVSGTSFASPFVAVELARRLAAPSPAAARQALQALGAEAVDLGAPGRDPVFGLGLVGAVP